MKTKFLVTGLALALPFLSASAQVFDEDNVLGQDVQEERHEGRQDMEESGKVIDSKSRQIGSEAADVSKRTIERGESEVDYKTKRQVTKTFLNKEKIPTIEECTVQADINKMEAKDFQAMGFDQKSAQQIVQQRQQQGNFQSVDDLSRVQGIPQDVLNRVRSDLGVAQKQAQEE